MLQDLELTRVGSEVELVLGELYVERAPLGEAFDVLDRPYDHGRMRVVGDGLLVT